MLKNKNIFNHNSHLKSKMDLKKGRLSKATRTLLHPETKCLLFPETSFIANVTHVHISLMCGGGGVRVWGDPIYPISRSTAHT